jgi:lysophospholipase L1-like esterase
MAALSLGAAEMVLRLLAPVPLEGSSQPAGPALRVTIKQDLPGLKPRVHYERNDYGLRTTAHIPGPKPAGVTRILCLGASTTDQATQNVEDTWCSRLGVGLDRKLGAQVQRFEAAGYGRGGYRAIDLLAWVEDSLEAVQPDVVVVLVGINDLAFMGGPGYIYRGLDLSLAASRRARGPKPPGKPSIARRLCPTSLQLCRRLILLKRRFTANPLEWHGTNLTKRRREYRRLPAVTELRRDPDPAVEFHDAVDSLVGTLQSRGIKTVLLGQPTLWSPDPTQEEEAVLWFGVETPKGKVRPSGRWLAQEMARYNSILEGVAVRREVSYLNLEARIPRTLDYFIDDCHFTDLGSERISDAILPVVGALQPRPVAVTGKTRGWRGRGRRRSRARARRRW